MGCGSFPCTQRVCSGGAHTLGEQLPTALAWPHHPPAHPPAPALRCAAPAVKLNANRHVTGVLRGFDQFMNLVLDNTVDEKLKLDIGMVVRQTGWGRRGRAAWVLMPCLGGVWGEGCMRADPAPGGWWRGGCSGFETLGAAPVAAP